MSLNIGELRERLNALARHYGDGVPVYLRFGKAKYPVCYGWSERGVVITETGEDLAEDELLHLVATAW